LELAQEILRLSPVSEREYSATTFAIRSDRIEEAKKSLREFREEFIRNFESDRPDQVYQFQFQFFPLTKANVSINE